MNKDLAALKKHLTQIAVVLDRMQTQSKEQPKRRGKKGVKKPKSKTPEQVLKPQAPKPRKVSMCKKCNVPRKGHKCEKAATEEPAQETN